MSKLNYSFLEAMKLAKKGSCFTISEECPFYLSRGENSFLNFFSKSSGEPLSDEPGFPFDSEDTENDWIPYVKYSQSSEKDSLLSMFKTCIDNLSCATSMTKIRECIENFKVIYRKLEQQKND